MRPSCGVLCGLYLNILKNVSFFFVFFWIAGSFKLSNGLNLEGILKLHVFEEFT